MRRVKYLLSEYPVVREVLLPALSLLFGLQLVRLFIPAMTWVLGDRFEINAVGLGIIAVAGFGLSLAVIPLRRFLCGYKALIFTAGGLSIVRLLAQINWGEPLINLLLATAGAALLGMFLAVYLDSARLKGYKTLSYLALGLLLGWTMDVSLNGLFGSYDYIFQSGVVPITIALLLALIQWLMLAVHNPITAEPPATAKTFPWQAIGFFLFLEFIIFGNIARLAALTDWTLPAAFGVVLAGQLAGLFAAAWLLSSKYRGSGSFNSIIGLLLLGSVILINSTDSAPLIGLILILGQVSVALLLTAIISGIGNHNPKRSYKSATLDNSVGMIIFVVLVLTYYAVYQISLPYPNTLLEVIAAVLLALFAITALRHSPARLEVKARFCLTPLLALVLLLAPVAGFIGWQDVEATRSDGGAVIIMTYNLHNGFNTEGRLDMEALAEVIEEQDPDIIALQEISRGWLISGGVDMLSWLSQRLEMPYVSNPTADDLWGNAILSKYPIINYSNYTLPPDDLVLERGFTVVAIDLGNSDLQVIATHFHHIEEDSAIRQQQAPIILAYANNAAATVILGDLNARPNSPEMEMFEQAGLRDTLSDQPQAFTYHTADLYERIDYIWLSADLVLLESYVPFSQASDHLAVVAVISPA
jgi:endonuclease/exonuclease/phosphatase family metal-dependent hydrolase